MTLSLAIGAGVAVLTGAGGGVGICIAAGRATRAMSHQPELTSKITSTMLLGCAMASSASIYGLVISLIPIFS